MVLTLYILASIHTPSTCSLEVTSIPHIPSAECRAILERTISRMMKRCQPFDLHLFVDAQLRFTMGNISDTYNTLVWVRHGEGKVLALLSSSEVPLLSITTFSSTVDEACRILPQLLEYFGSVTYDLVTSFRMTLSSAVHRLLHPLKGCQLKKIDGRTRHPQAAEIFDNLQHLFGLLENVTSLSVNEEGALAIDMSDSAKRKANPTITTLDFPHLQHFVLHAHKSLASTLCAREIISSRRRYGSQVLTAIIPPAIPDAYIDAELLEWMHETTPTGSCQIQSTPPPPQTRSLYFDRFCARM
ncbi:hypothetical protein NMY22_g16705 [Coprinellus aureogranulatus]|nr:hypothetical protein NMY22_g16705 [Coprinellus aureogranulatus]